MSRRALGLAVFVGALGLWEAWGRGRPSFLVPPASVVLERAWEVWPTGDFLGAVGASLGRLAVPPETRDTAALLRLGAVERTLRVYLPAASPSIAAGVRVAAPIGLVLIVISELTGEGEGIGRYIVFQQSQFNVPEVYGGILFLGLLGFALNALVALAERRLLAWHDGATGAAR